MTRYKCESELIDDVLGGNRESFGAFVERYQQRLTNAVAQIVSCRSDAEDIVQEAFVRGYQRLDRFRRQSSLLTWFYRIAMNLAFTHRRRVRHNVSLDGHLSARGDLKSKATAAPDDNLLRQERADALRDAFRQLDQGYRDVLLLREMEGCDYKTIAARLNVPVGTVRIRLHRGRNQLRELLQKTVA